LLDGSEENKICFIISPIGNEESEERNRRDKLMEFVIEPVLKEFNIKPYSADDISKSGDIPTQIVEHLIKANFVIADLSDLNPNVFYELAIRHMTERPCIQMICKGQSSTIPFDLYTRRTIFYDDDFNHRDVRIVKNKLSEYIKGYEKEPLLENIVSSTIRKISGERFLQDLYPNADKSVLSFLIDSNMDILDAIFQVSMDIQQTQWYISHPNMFESRKNEEYYPSEYKLSRPGAYDTMQYRKMNYDQLKEQGASESDLLKLKMEIYKDFLEVKYDMHNQKASQIRESLPKNLY